MSDRDDWPADQNEQRQETKSSSSGCLKIALILGGLGLFCMLLCCGGGFWIASTMVPKETKNPAEVAQVGQQIMQIDIPPEFEGESAITIDNFFMTVQMANFKNKTGESHLRLGKVEIKIANLKDQQQDFKGKFGGNGDDLSLDIQKSETREFVIDGKKVPFRFSEAVDRKSKKDFRVVEGEIGTPVSGKFLKLVIEADDYDEDEVVKMIESIH